MENGTPKWIEDERNFIHFWVNRFGSIFFVFLACLNIKSNLHSWKKIEIWNRYRHRLIDWSETNSILDLKMKNFLNLEPKKIVNSHVDHLHTRPPSSSSIEFGKKHVFVVIGMCIQWIWIYQNLLSAICIYAICCCYCYSERTTEKLENFTIKFCYRCFVVVIKSFFSFHFIIIFQGNSWSITKWHEKCFFCFVLFCLSATKFLRKTMQKKNPCCYTFDPLIPWNEIDWKLLPMIMMPMQWTSRYFFSTELNSIHHHQHDHHEYEENHSMHTGQPPKSI